MDMQKLIENITAKVKRMKDAEQELIAENFYVNRPDERSLMDKTSFWEEEGVLISANQAIALVNEISTLSSLIHLLQLQNADLRNQLNEQTNQD